MAVEVPHLKLPFRLLSLGAQVLEQDSPEEMQQCAETVLRYSIGDRIESPQFGIPDQAFREGGPDLEIIRSALALWEPRMEMEISAAPDKLDELISNVRVIMKEPST